MTTDDMTQATVPTDHETETLLRCPTCSARQAWSAECRRCKCDLAPLWKVRRLADTARDRFLLAARQDHWDQALHWAEIYCRLVPDLDGIRFMAVAHAKLGRWEESFRLAGSVA